MSTEPEHLTPDAVYAGEPDRRWGAAQDVPPRHPHPGHCAVCDVKLENGRQWYCPEHRGEGKRRRNRNRAAAAQRSVTAERVASSPARARVTAIPGKVSDASATTTLAKLLVIFMVVLLHYRLKRNGIADPDGERADALSPTNQEAKDMVGPVARWGNSTALGARVIGPISRNEDIVLSAYAWFEWWRRVDRFFEAERRGGLAPVVPIRAAGAEGAAPAPVQHASDQVIVPHEDFAPPGFHAVVDPLSLSPDGAYGGGGTLW